MKKLFLRIKSVLRRFYWFIFMPVDNVIVFESIPDVSDNTRAVFDEMLRRGLNKKYKFVWVVTKSADQFDEIENVIYLNRNDSVDNQQLNTYLIKAKCIICCNLIYRKKRCGQKSFYLSHGTTLKSLKKYYTVPPEVDYCLVASDSQQIIDLQSYELDFDQSRAMPLGYPRNDILTKPAIDIKKPLCTNCDKVIVWYPTYRQHKNGSVCGVSENALPIIHSVQAAKEINAVAKKNNTLIVLKPHFAQDVSYIKELNLSNIRFIDDNFFVKNSINSYEFVAACDALITDYSSIYYDFTLCNKPVAAIWEDIEEYKQNPGLIEDYEFYMKGAEKIYTVDEFTAFIQRIADGVDLLQSERNEIRDIVNYSTDGKNSIRVVDFIIEKAKL